MSVTIIKDSLDRLANTGVYGRERALKRAIALLDLCNDNASVLHRIIEEFAIEEIRLAHEINDPNAEWTVNYEQGKDLTNLPRIASKEGIANSMLQVYNEMRVNHTRLVEWRELVCKAKEVITLLENIVD